MFRTITKAVAYTTGGILLVAIALIVWPRNEAPLPRSAAAYLIEGVRVVDVEAGVAGAAVSVLIENGTITAIGTPVAARQVVRLDGRGRYLLPGLWDMHAHTFQHSPQVEFPLWLANGVTNIRDMMDCPEEHDSLIACVADKRRWNERAERGEMAAPRIVEVGSYYLEGPALTPVEASERISIYRARGIDAVKVYNRLSRPTYLRAAADAGSRGMRLVGHLPKVVSLEEAISVGQVSFEHAHLFARHCFSRSADWREGKLDRVPPTELAEAVVKQHDAAACARAFRGMRDAGAWYVPTHVTREEDARAGDPSFINDPRGEYLDPLSRWAYRDDLTGTRSAYPGPRGELALRNYFDHGLRLTGEAHRAGVSVLVGTDTALGGFRYHDELGHLAKAGLQPAAILRAATIDAARYAGLERSSGSVTVGKRADVVLLNANPLVNIANTRRIHAVFVRGRLYDRARLSNLLAFARGQAAAPHNWAKLLWAFARSSVTSDL